VPRGGTNKKPLAEHAKAGTLRKSRHKPETPPPPANDKTAPAGMSKALTVEWRSIVSDLEAQGIVSMTDLTRLAQAFKIKANAERIQANLDEAMNDGNPSNIAKLQSAHASAVRTADGLIVLVERAVKLRPKKEEADAWES
jgi:hypothetical protein